MTPATDLRARPEHGWVAAVLPDGVRRIRVVGDDALASMLAATGADVTGHDPEVTIGPARCVVGDTPLAVVPIAALGQLDGPRHVRLARRIAVAVAVRARAARARRALRRLYPRTATTRWDVQQAVRTPDVRGRRRAVERLPRAAVVTGWRTEPGPTLYELAVRDAGTAIGRPLEASHPRVTGGGTLVTLAGPHVLRVAAGPGCRHLQRQHAALTELWAQRPPELVTARLPRPLAGGDRSLGGWLLEDRLPGAAPGTVDGALLEDCVAFLVALHGCGRGGSRPPLAAAADVVNALSGSNRDGLRRLAGRLDEHLTGLPVGFAHGDFWRENLLADGEHLVGVVDWEHAGSGRLPLLDLLQLVATQPRDDARSITAVVVGRLLPWARAGGDPLVRRYCGLLDVEPEPATLQRLVLAFWLDRLARQLEKCGDRGGSPRWTADNVDPVLATVGIDPG